MTKSSTQEAGSRTFYPRRKKTRTIFTRAQLCELEAKFYTHPYLSNVDRMKISKQLSLNENQVKVWFQNRRNKMKKEMTVNIQQARAYNAFPACHASDQFNQSAPTTCYNHQQQQAKFPATFHHDSITLNNINNTIQKDIAFDDSFSRENNFTTLRHFQSDNYVNLNDCYYGNTSILLPEQPPLHHWKN